MKDEKKYTDSKHWDESNAERMLYSLVESRIFSERVAVHTRKTVQDILTYLAAISIPLIIVIISLGVYIFQITNSNIERLTGSVTTLEKVTSNFNSTISVLATSLKVIDERSRENTQTVKDIVIEKRKDSTR